MPIGSKSQIFVINSLSDSTYEFKGLLYSQPKIYDKIAATDTKCKYSVNSFSLH